MNCLLLIAWLTWAIAIGIALSSCQMASIIGTPPDVESCANLGDHGYCRFSISHRSYFVDDGTGHKYTDIDRTEKTAQQYTDPQTGKKYKWADLVQVSVVVPPASFAKFKSWADNVCHQVDCDNGVGSWSDVVTDIDRHRARSK